MVNKSHESCDFPSLLARQNSQIVAQGGESSGRVQWLCWVEEMKLPTNPGRTKHLEFTGSVPERRNLCQERGSSLNLQLSTVQYKCNTKILGVGDYLNRLEGTILEMTWRREQLMCSPARVENLITSRPLDRILRMALPQ